MRRQTWAWPRSPVPCDMLIPEDDGEREELQNNLFDLGVKHRMAFSHDRKPMRLEIPGSSCWDTNGAAKVEVTVEVGKEPIPGWFWIVECGGDPSTRAAWWGLDPDPMNSSSWK
eukprot:GHVT01077255.1.p3 GENE.GHVT01077255.1~~GHVT01077255.1.p3  ORF type:complete len:114 (+),score=13.37 GHVT01077255.1:132-473(+)